MHKNGLITLVAITACAAVLALLPSSGPESAAPADAGQIVLSTFAAHPEAAAVIELHGGAGQTTLKRAPSGRWVVAEKDGYPADQARVAKALLGLARLRLVEARTRRPDLYPRLAVEQPAGPDAASTLVRLRDAGGANLGEVIVGHGKPDQLGGGNDGTYVRRPNDVQAWLAEGSVAASPVAGDWLDRRIAAIDPIRIARIVTTQPDGTRFELARARAEDDLKLPDAPADAKYIRPFKRTDLAGLLNGLDFVDVRAASAITLPPSHLTATWTSFDGLTITAELTGQGGVQWLRLSAAGRDPEAGMLNAGWSPWVFAIPEAKANTIRIKRADILEDTKS